MSIARPLSRAEKSQSALLSTLQNTVSLSVRAIENCSHPQVVHAPSDPISHWFRYPLVSAISVSKTSSSPGLGRHGQQQWWQQLAWVHSSSPGSRTTRAWAVAVVGTATPGLWKQVCVSSHSSHSVCPFSSCILSQHCYQALLVLPPLLCKLLLVTWCRHFFTGVG